MDKETLKELGIEIANIDKVSIDFKDYAELVEKARKFDAISEKEKPHEPIRWRPSVGEKYFFIDEYGEKDWDIWGNHEMDTKRWEAGNCFRTEEDSIDSYILLGFKLQQDEYHYWIPGVDMPRPDELPENLEKFDGKRWELKIVLPQTWEAYLYRWPK